MKKYITFLIVLFIYLSSSVNVKALSISENNLSLTPGTSTLLELNEDTDYDISKIEFNLVYYSYDVTGIFLSNYNDTTSGISHTIIFDESVTGNINLGNIKVNVVNTPAVKSSNININNIRLTTITGEVITKDNITVTVNINNEETPIDIKKEEVKDNEKVSNLLDKIESNIVNITLKEDVYEYDITIDSDITSLDLNPISKYDKTTIDISSQDINSLEDNKIIIKVSLEDVNEEYIINVKVKEKEVKIDNNEYKKNNNYKTPWIIIIIILSIGLVVSIMFARKKK